MAVVERLEYKESAAYLEHHFRHQHGVLVCASQVECVIMSHTLLVRLCPAVPTWWAEVEVPHGMPVLPNSVVSLRGSLLQRDRPDCCAAAALCIAWLRDVTVVLVVSVVTNKLLWVINQDFVSIIYSAGPDVLCRADPRLCVVFLNRQLLI